MRACLFLILFVLPTHAGVIALKSGRILKCDGPFEIKSSMILYRDAEGNLYELPLKLVDLDRSDPGQKVKAGEPLQAPQPKPEPPNPKIPLDALALEAYAQREKLLKDLKLAIFSKSERVAQIIRATDMKADNLLRTYHPLELATKVSNLEAARLAVKAGCDPRSAKRNGAVLIGMAMDNRDFNTWDFIQLYVEKYPVCYYNMN